MLPPGYASPLSELRWRRLRTLLAVSRRRFAGGTVILGRSGCPLRGLSSLLAGPQRSLVLRARWCWLRCFLTVSRCCSGTDDCGNSTSKLASGVSARGEPTARWSGGECIGLGVPLGCASSVRRFGAIANETRKLVRSVRNYTMQKDGTRNKHTRKTAAGQAQGLRVPYRTLPCPWL